MIARLIIMAGFASAIILTAFAVLIAMRVELRPLTPQKGDAIAELGEKVAQAVKEQEAAREARLRGEPLPEPERKPFPRQEVLAMMARSTEDAHEMEHLLAQMKDAGSQHGGASDRDADLPPEAKTVEQLFQMTYAYEINRLFKYDTNGDGVLDRAELEKSAGRNVGPVRSPFRSAEEILRADRNGDGRLTREELLADAKKGFMSKLRR